jgi:acid phosphatase type 7
MTRAALLVLLSLPAAAAAAPTAVRLSFVDDPSTSMAVSWNVPAGTTEGRVELWQSGEGRSGATKAGEGRSGATKGKDDKPSVVRARLQAFGPRALVAEAVLRGLRPSALYRYRVGDEAGGFSPRYTFRTAPPPRPDCGRLRFAVLGDSRSGSPDPHKGAARAWPALLTRAASHLPAFILHTGDIVHRGRHHEQWSDHLEVSSPVSALIPILYTLGNHDTGPGVGERANFNRALALPRASRAIGGSGTEDYYAFRYGNALFLVLSTESFIEGSSPMADQARWTDRVLASTPARWRIVLLHRPMRTGAPRIIGHRPNEIGHNAALGPVIDRHHVDLVFAGHNHFYERFAPSPAGTIHVTTGGGGAPVIPFAGATSAERPVAVGKRHYVLVEIADETLRLEARDASGAPIDSLTLRKAGGATCPRSAAALP